MNIETYVGNNIERHLSLSSDAGDDPAKARTTSSGNGGGNKGTRNRFANIKATQQVANNRSIKFSANNFVTQSYDAFTEHYEIVELLGEGGYGEVFVCAHKESGAERAVKVLHVETEEDAAKVMSEFEILKGIDHPNMLKVYHLYEDKDANNFYIVSDLYEGGELFDEIEAKGEFVEEDAAIIMNQVLSCINYCHGKGIVHRDIKPENILLATEGSLEDVKVIDFGLAATFEEDSKSARFFEKAGSSYYIAPEVMKGDYGTKCDVWSSGVVAFILIAGEAPFDGDDDDEIMESILRGEFTFEDNELWDDCSEDCKDFVKMLLTYDETKRPTAEEALQHPWLKDTRRVTSAGLKERKDVRETARCFSNLEKFDPYTKLHQVTCAFIASQLITKTEKDAVDEIFRALDGSCDGSLVKEELRQGFKEFQGRDLTDKEVDAIFERVNYSCSGAIEYSEFLVASIELDEGRLRATFSEFAKGGDFLSTSDLGDLLATKEGSDSVVQKIMEETDVDHDGYISFDDFKASMAKMAPSVVTPSGQFSFTSNFSAASRNTRAFNKSMGHCSLRRTDQIFFDDDDDDDEGLDFGALPEEGGEDEEPLANNMSYDFGALLEKVSEDKAPPGSANAMSCKLHLARRAHMNDRKAPRKIKTLGRSRTGQRQHAFSIGYCKQSKEIMNASYSK